MTVENQTPSQSYTTNGVEASFTLTFHVEGKDNLLIKLNDEVVSKNEYSYLKSSNAVQFNTPLSANQKLEIFRKTRLERATNYESFNNTFRPEVLNKDLDKIWYSLQEQSHKVDQYDHDYEYAVSTAHTAQSIAQSIRGRADDAYTLAEETNTEIRPITRGGTGSNNKEDARINLDVHSKSEVIALIQTGGAEETLGIEGGGTGAITATKARTNLDVYSKVEVDNKSGLPLGHIYWLPIERTKVPDGSLALDGYTYNRADYPDLWEKINSGFCGRVVTDAQWLLKTGLNRACYSSGNGSTTFRTPDLNGIQPDSIKSPVLRGDKYNPSGTVLGDAIRDIQGNTNWMSYIDSPETQYNSKPSISGAFYMGEAKGFTVSGANYQIPNENSRKPMAFKASLVVPTADENRPNSAFGIWLVIAKGKTEAAPSLGLYPTLTGGNNWNGSQNVSGDLTVFGTFKADIKTLINATGNAPISACRAWVVFTCVSNVITILNSMNILSVTRLGTSNFKITYATPMPTANNVPLASGSAAMGTNSQYAMPPAIRNILADSCEVYHYSPIADFPLVTLGVFC